MPPSAEGLRRRGRRVAGIGPGGQRRGQPLYPAASTNSESPERCGALRGGQSAWRAKDVGGESHDGSFGVMLLGFYRLGAQVDESFGDVDSHWAHLVAGTAQR